MFMHDVCICDDECVNACMDVCMYLRLHVPKNVAAQDCCWRGLCQWSAPRVHFCRDEYDDRGSIGTAVAGSTVSAFLFVSGDIMP